MIFDAKTHALERSLHFPNNGVIRCMWNPRINQIFASTARGVLVSMNGVAN